MVLLLTLAYLFFIGSTLGWVAELLYRRFLSGANPERKWINPGFCVGPYVPLYGSGLCILYLLASLGEKHGVDTAGEKLLLFAGMALSMTVIEYIAGIVSLKFMKIRLWDYSKQWGNIQGLICPAFSALWAAVSAVYYFCVHPYILDALDWLSRNLAFSFVIGYFFGVFTIDLVYSAKLLSRIRKFADEHPQRAAGTPAGSAGDVGAEEAQVTFYGRYRHASDRAVCQSPQEGKQHPGAAGAVSGGVAHTRTQR